MKCKEEAGNERKKSADKIIGVETAQNTVFRGSVFFFLTKSENVISERACRAEIIKRKIQGVFENPRLDQE